MRYGIINAEQTEMDGILAALQDESVMTVQGMPFHVGRLGQAEVVVVKSGIGKVAAAVTATLLITKFEVNYLINSGSAGALGGDLHVGDVVIANELAYFDADARVFGYEFGQVPQQPARFSTDERLSLALAQSYGDQQTKVQHGMIVSGDTFINSMEQKQAIVQAFPHALAGEMEGAAVAQVAHQFAIPFAVVRAISDNANGEAGMSYDEFVVQAGQQSATVLVNYFKQA
ncbi:hypothetical protein IV73_GL000955 [Weissella kandleri]|uniref:adenosylhomocysteine nucleosidase n=1 Tax=Weissella kandleri TaxID=1616 RepID=A0A0R2JCY5_9LACO|nr:5'-methylthioadenosine/adenosylhomocysteine nucleosidase [Weissella kandleri]KRN75193.1 hypothetical protein IV73_GL000955 [Weissella kandleri]